MNDPVYFTKVQFNENLITRLSVILLNIPERELSYQIMSLKRNGSPAITGVETVEVMDKRYQFDVSYPAKKISHAKTDFRPVLIKEDPFYETVDFSYGMKLDETQMNSLLPLCNALDFEPYRDREMNMDDEGYVGYRDEISVSFLGITDSYLPLLELPMEYYYDEQHIWPSEKLYRFLVRDILEKQKELKNKMFCYGDFSLFC